MPISKKITMRSHTACHRHSRVNLRAPAFAGEFRIRPEEPVCKTVKAIQQYEQESKPPTPTA